MVLDRDNRANVSPDLLDQFGVNRLTVGMLITPASIPS